MEVKKIINEFLPDKIFDAHMHLYDQSYFIKSDLMPESVYLDDFVNDLKGYVGNKEIHANILPFPCKRIIDKNDGVDYLKVSDDFIYSELKKDEKSVAEILVLPTETEDDIIKRIKDKRISGLKPYHLLHHNEITTDLAVDEFLPESAFAVADKLGLVITLHIMKDESLFDARNQKYIIEMSKKYPNAILILAHDARSFASWTGIESIDKVSKLDNVMFDLSAVCESPAMIQTIKKCGVSKVMWGTDYPVSNVNGKCISLADKFYWIYEKREPQIAKSVKMWSILEETIMAIRQMAIILDLTESDIEDIFYNNAQRLFFKK
jgi:glutamate-1-semialdehyde 2,1-aminomutase